MLNILGDFYRRFRRLATFSVMQPISIDMPESGTSGVCFPNRRYRPLPFSGAIFRASDIPTTGGRDHASSRKTIR
jgi:hypothetical protein